MTVHRSDLEVHGGTEVLGGDPTALPGTHHQPEVRAARAQPGYQTSRTCSRQQITTGHKKDDVDLTEQSIDRAVETPPQVDHDKVGAARRGGDDRTQSTARQLDRSVG